MQRNRRRGLLSLPVFLGVMVAIAAAVATPWSHASAASPCGSNCTIFNPATQPSGQSLFNELEPVSLGTEFHSDVAGTLTALRYYQDPQNGSSPFVSHPAHVWSASGTLLASATFPTPTSGGWQQVPLATPLAISAGTNYWVSYYASDGLYDATTQFPYPADNAPLHATAAAFHNYQPDQFPDTPTINSANYWADVVFQSPADVAVTNSAPGLFLLGDRLTNTLGVTNHGPGTATNVTLTDTTSGASFKTATPSQGTCTVGATVVCNLGTLAPGASATVRVGSDPVLLGTVHNVATVQADEPDPNPSNNTASTNTLVVLSLL